MRSILCVPGHKALELEAKARAAGAGAILWDLEDAVPAGLKAEALRQVAAVVRAGDHVRINVEQLDAEIEVAFAAGTVWIPKVDDRTTLRVTLLDCRIVPILETPRGVSRINDSVGNAAIAFGAMDFAATAGVGLESHLIDFARRKVALIAAAAGVPAFDSPCFHEDLLDQEVAEAIDLGFAAKGCLTPRQVQIVNERFERARQHDRHLAEVALAAAPEEAVWRDQASGWVLGPSMRRAMERAR